MGAMNAPVMNAQIYSSNGMLKIKLVYQLLFSVQNSMMNPGWMINVNWYMEMNIMVR
jgi:hypothetical protein